MRSSPTCSGSGSRPGTSPRRWRSRWMPRPRSAWADHDPPAEQKLVPFGILMVATGALMLIFGTRDTSDAWVDALKFWWLQVRDGLGHVKRLVIYLDNG